MRKKAGGKEMRAWDSLQAGTLACSDPPLSITRNGRRETGDEEAAVRIAEDTARSRQRMAQPIA